MQMRFQAHRFLQIHYVIDEPASASLSYRRRSAGAKVLGKLAECPD
jgi:hypothetical protein